LPLESVSEQAQVAKPIDANQNPIEVVIEGEERFVNR
jgi:hypothetical protein